MKNLILYLLLFIFSIINTQAQIKLYNIDLPYFDKKNIVKADKVIKTTNRINNYITQITEYNNKGQFHGAVIGFRNDQSVSFIKYYHNNILVYSAQPFLRGKEIEKVFNYNVKGSFNGIQVYTYLNSDTNKWNKTEFIFNNGRLTNIDKIKFPDYTANFKDGKLDGEFYFYDNLHCSCYYYGMAESGKIRNISKFEIGNALSFRNTIYDIKDNSIKSTTFFDYQNPREELIEITEIPVVVENKNINVGNNKNRIIYDKQNDWMQILANISSYYDSSEDEIDWSKASVGLPSEYTLPAKRQ